MTREEAIDLLDNLIGMIEDNHNSDYDTAFKMAIKALKQNESAEEWYKLFVEKLEQESSGDAISRQMAIVALDNRMSSLENVGMRIAMKIAKDIIHDLPPVNPQEPKTGHWEWLTEDKYRCSNCNSETKVDECLNEPMYEFCPFCGCPMVGEEV